MTDRTLYANVQNILKMLGGGGAGGGSLPPGGGTAKSHLDNTLPDLVREAGYQFTSSLETCRSYLRQWVSSNEILSATVARIIGVMVRTHTGNKGNIFTTTTRRCSSEYFKGVNSYGKRQH